MTMKTIRTIALTLFVLAICIFTYGLIDGKFTSSQSDTIYSKQDSIFIESYEKAIDEAVKGAIMFYESEAVWIVFERGKLDKIAIDSINAKANVPIQINTEIWKNNIRIHFLTYKLNSK